MTINRCLMILFIVGMIFGCGFASNESSTNEPGKPGLAAQVNEASNALSQAGSNP